MPLLAASILSMAFVVEPPAGQPDQQEATTGEIAGNPVDDLLDTLGRDGLGGLRTLWSEIGVSSGLFEGLDDSTPLQVARFAAELDDDAAEETLLRITDSEGRNYQYLALEHAGDSWIGLGHVDLWNQRTQPPTHRIETLQGVNRWLVIRSLRGSGGGFSRTHETWHDAADGLQTVLDYPVDGHVSGHGMLFDRSFSGTQVALSGGDVPTVEVEFNVRYTASDEVDIEGLDELFSRNATVRYTRDDESSAFSVDDDQSDMTEAEVIGIFADDADGFLLHNFAPLRQIAAEGPEPKQQWLRRFLKICQDSSEKTILKQLLDPDATTSTTDASAASESQ